MTAFITRRGARRGCPALTTERVSAKFPAVPQIRELHITNFRCLRDVHLTFEPLTILVGPNAAGKTALLDALELRPKVKPENVWRREPGLTVQRSGRLDNGQEFRADLGPTVISPLLHDPWRSLRLQLVPAKLRAANQVADETDLARDGGNLTNVFASLSRTVQGELAARFCDLVPLYADLDVRPLHGGTHRLVFQDRWIDTWYEPHQVSDGTMVLLAFLTLAHLRNAPDILAIEEPEYALHPYLVGEVVALLRKLAHGELGKPVQVILATHSAELLNFAQPTEVRFLSRSLEDGSTRVRTAPLETDEWRAAFAEYEESMGELWLSGSLGGVPGTTTAQ